MIGTSAQPWIISSLNIFFHEAGHVLFAFFGEFMMVLGGTLGELLFPLLFLGYFWYHRQIPGQVFSLWWMTTALYSISIYMADARARVLPLIGGQGGHDWSYLFGRLNILEYDILISRMVIILALMVTIQMCIMVYEY